MTHKRNKSGSGLCGRNGTCSTYWSKVKCGHCLNLKSKFVPAISPRRDTLLAKWMENTEFKNWAAAS